MISGDHPRTAARIAADLGITEAGGQVLSGPEIDRLTEPDFRRVVAGRRVRAGHAQHKLRIVDALQADGAIVAMTGDGVNDAPALKSADIGVAMGVAGTEVTKQAAKMVLADDNFATIVEAVREGRQIFANIRKALRYLLSSNMGEVLTVFLGVVLAGGIGLAGADGAVALPLLATQILWINLLTDSGPALALGVDREADNVMGRPPRSPRDRVIDARMWSSVILIGTVMATVTLLTIDLYLPGGWIAGDQTSTPPAPRASRCWCWPSLFHCFVARSANRAPSVDCSRTAGCGSPCCCPAPPGGGGAHRVPRQGVRDDLLALDDGLCAWPWPAASSGSRRWSSWSHAGLRAAVSAAVRERPAEAVGLHPATVVSVGTASPRHQASDSSPGGELPAGAALGG